MNLKSVIIAICSLLFLMIGLDKFFEFLQPPCSLNDKVSLIAWKAIGVAQIISGVLIWKHPYRKYIVGFFFVFMIVFSMIHLSQNTHDIGGSTFMAVMLGLLLWHPPFLRKPWRSK